jgi:hypothetical protein
MSDPLDHPQTGTGSRHDGPLDLTRRQALKLAAAAALLPIARPQARTPLRVIVAAAASAASVARTN